MPQTQPKSPRLSLYDLTPHELVSFFLSIGEPAYRSKQVVDSLYRHPAESFEKFTTLSKPLREKLASTTRLAPLVLRATLEAPDGTIKNTYEVTRTSGHGACLESVWMSAEPTDVAPLGNLKEPETRGAGVRKNRHTICISSQLGCAVGCTFCATGHVGLKGQLTAGEIVYQVVHSRILYNEYPDAVLFMGMGEPMHNFEAVIAVVEIITHEDGLGFSPRRVVVSTSGELEKLGQFHARFPRVRLAISLNAGTDSVRSSLIPLNDKYDMGTIASFVHSLDLGHGDKVTFEYVLLAGINDTPEQVRALIGFLKPLAGRVKVNLIPYNPTGDGHFRAPQMVRVFEIQKAIRALGMGAFIRRNRGRGVAAACGQLAGRL
jgi:23S rRNA (adenine2503-C2)-methyltransferase